MTMNPAEIRQAVKQNPDRRARDLATDLQLSEGQLVAAFVGDHEDQSATRVQAHSDHLMPAISRLGEVMALTRNKSAVHERIGTYGDYHSNPHACMVVGPEIDLRIFPKHWVHAFAVENAMKDSVQRSIQVFDAAGDAIHKVFLKEQSNHDAWSDVVTSLRVDDQSEGIEVTPRAPTEPPKRNSKKRDLLLTEWAKMTDTHQFFRLCSKCGMNRLGAYHAALGTEWVREVEGQSMTQLLYAASKAKQKVILFVGNAGNIQIHWGLLENIKELGPWINVLDERFNLHLRQDHIASAYVVKKPTKRGDALSLEVFDTDGFIICQIFSQRDGENDPLTNWRSILDDLPSVT